MSAIPTGAAMTIAIIVLIAKPVGKISPSSSPPPTVPVGAENEVKKGSTRLTPNSEQPCWYSMQVHLEMKCVVNAGQ
jgi:hypothetical protein